MLEDEKMRNRLRELVQDGLDKKVKPLPYKIYDDEKIEEAMRFMSGGKPMEKF